MRLSLVLSTVLLAAAVCARPYDWIEATLNLEQTLNGQAPEDICSMLPDRTYGEHKGVVIDKESSITLKDTKTQQVSKGKLCVGQNYNGQIIFPAKSGRRSILVASLGDLFYMNESIAQQQAAQDTQCLGKRLWWKAALETIPFRFNIHAHVTPGQKVVLKVASAADRTDSFHLLSATYTVENCSTIVSGGEASTEQQSRKLQQTSVGLYNGVCAPEQFQGANCPESDVGYACAVSGNATGPHFVTHYSVGGCPPSNACTDIAEWYIDSADITSQPLIHMYATAECMGYISLAFATDATKMHNADAVYAYREGDKVKSYVFPLKEQIANKEDETFDVKSYLAYFGFVEEGGNISICFGRVEDLTTKNIAKINVPKLDYKQLQITWAKDDRVGLVTHLPDEYGRGGFVLNLEAGGSEGLSLQSDIDDFRIIHGAFLAAAWAFLVPFAVLTVRHKWYFTKPLMGGPTWFTVHRGFNALAFIFTLIGCIIAFIKLDIVHEPKNTGNAHKVIGIIMFSFSCLQILLSFKPVRPNGGEKYRPLWNNVHWWLGRATLIGSIVTIFLGIYQFHQVAPKKVYAKYVAWLVPVCVSLCGIYTADMWLCIKRAREEKAKQVAKEIEAPVIKDYGTNA